MISLRDNFNPVKREERREKGRVGGKNRQGKENIIIHTHTHTHNALHFHNLMIPSRDALIINCCVKFCGLL